MEEKAGIIRQGEANSVFPGVPLVCLSVFAILQPKSKIKNHLTDYDYSGKLEIVEEMRV